MSPMLYGWYRVLDKWMPGTSTMISIKKSVIDVLGCGIPYYSAFYCGKSLAIYSIILRCRTIQFIIFRVFSDSFVLYYLRFVSIGGEKSARARRRMENKSPANVSPWCCCLDTCPDYQFQACISPISGCLCCFVCFVGSQCSLCNKKIIP